MFCISAGSSSVVHAEDLVQGLCTCVQTNSYRGTAIAEASGCQQLFLCCDMSNRLSVIEAGLTITFSAEMSQLHLAILTPQVTYVYVKKV